MKSSERTKQTGEVFTPLKLVNEILDKLQQSDPLIFSPEKTYIDPACGHGNFLIEVFKRTDNLDTIYGVDLMIDNVCDTIARLQFIKLTDSDPFNEEGSPKKELKEYEEHHNDYNFEYLKTHQKFERGYVFCKHCIFVSFSHMLEGDNGSLAGVFKYSIDGAPDIINKNIVCADGLTFAYNFENIEKRVGATLAPT